MHAQTDSTGAEQVLKRSISYLPAIKPVLILLVTREMISN